MAGFGFIKQAAQKAGKKMYGYGQKAKGVVEKYPGAAIGGAGLATVGGLTAGGVLQADWDGSKQLADEYIVNYMKNDHVKFMTSKFDAKKDIPHLREVLNNAFHSLEYRMHGKSKEEIQAEQIAMYKRFLSASSQRKGSPSAEELHNILNRHRSSNEKIS